MRKAVAYLAVSLDGYIADADGGVGWLGAFADEQEDRGYEAGGPTARSRKNSRPARGRTRGWIAGSGRSKTARCLTRAVLRAGWRPGCMRKSKRLAGGSGCAAARR